MMVLLVLATVLPASAVMQVEGTENVRLPKAALDVATTADGAKLFVLLKGGEVQVLSPGGQLIDQLTVAPESEQLSVSPEGDRLYLTVGQELRIVEVASKHELPVLNSPVKGPANAPVTLTLFSDFQCPYCSRMVPLLDEVLAKNPDKVRLVFKQFPLRMHNMAEPAALASLAAQEQGKFWPLHDLLFANSSQLSEEKIRSLAKQAGLDMARFDRDRNAPRLREEIKRDMALGQQAGVQGTPSLYLNGKLLRVRTPQEMQSLIDREAARAKAGK
jgi:protein-disulfide isomerase